MELVINGRQDEFGFPATIPATALFDPKNVGIVSNGRYAYLFYLFYVTPDINDPSAATA